MTHVSLQRSSRKSRCSAIFDVLRRQGFIRQPNAWKMVTCYFSSLRPQPMMRQYSADSVTLTYFTSLWSKPGTALYTQRQLLRFYQLHCNYRCIENNLIVRYSIASSDTRKSNLGSRKHACRSPSRTCRVRDQTLCCEGDLVDAFRNMFLTQLDT